MQGTQPQACYGCEVFKQVRLEEGSAFQLLAATQPHHQALFEQFTSLMSIIEAMNAVVYVSDLQTYELLFVNSYTARLFGEGILGEPCYQVLQKGQTRPCRFCTNPRLLVDGAPAAPVVWEFQNTLTGRWFLCTDRAIRWWDGRWVRMEIALDITDRKTAEQHRDQCMHLLSHDLRNPLSALMLRVSVLERDLERKGLFKEQAALGEMRRNARQINALIDELLETSRLEGAAMKLERARLELRTWVADAIRSSPAAHRERVRLSLGAEALMVRADPDRLERVLQNLMSNALKYSGDQPVAIEVERRGEEAVVSVIDQGVGVPPDEVPRLFQRFFRASTAGTVKGLGLGLYSARLVMEAHGGRIWVDSELGRGANFHFALPLADA